MRKRYVYCEDRKRLVPAEEYYAERASDPAGPYIQPDIEPYQCVGGDMAGQYITSRSQHRAFLKRNGFEEVGNETRAFFEYGGRTADNPRARRRSDWDERHQRFGRKFYKNGRPTGEY